MNKVLLLLICLIMTGCDGQAWNNPYPEEEKKANIFYSSFAERPATLDPARAYSSDAYLFIRQVYETPLQYHYLKRPYTLVALAAESMPTVTYFDKQNKPLPENAPSNQINTTVYTIHIKPGRRYHPHPAFAKDENNQYRYHHLPKNYLEEHDIRQLSDFQYAGTRELVAEDYVYQIKRLAHPQLQSPILGLMMDYIVGLSDYAKHLAAIYEKQQDKNGFLDLRRHSLPGVKATGRYTYQITIRGKYPQFLYWLAMPFFAPMPWEADLFDSLPGMLDYNMTLDWYPIGTGPYQLTENNPNRRMVLSRNPYFAGEAYPTTGAVDDEEKGLLKDAGKPMPFIDKAIFVLEKESIPRWNKFLQGYYDNSGVTSDSFEQAIQIGLQGEATLTAKMQERNVHLLTQISPAIMYMGFNMLDPVVGGNSQRARLLRQAISIAVDYEEFIAIFANGQGIVAQSPIPPGIFGYEEGKAGINPVVYEWKQGRPQRRSLAEAKALLAKAGYPNGRDRRTGKVLTLNYDVPASSGPDDKARFDWMRKQFAKLGIELHIRATQYNRFQEKMRTGHAQIFSWGWHADYPDPENFLFLLYSPNGKVKYHGENAANYSNPDYDRLFDIAKNLPNGEKRLSVIQQMIKILQRDTPWIWGLHPKDFILVQDWMRISKPGALGGSTLKYARLDPTLRAAQRTAWNQPVYWPLLFLLGAFLLVALPVVLHYWRREYLPPSLHKGD